MHDIYTKDRTALLFVDPYNDFLSEGGKLWPLVEGVAREVGLLDNLRSITAAVRRAGIRIFIVPRHRWEPGDYERWSHPNPDQLASGKRQVFAKGAWGGEWHPDFVPQSGDIIIKEHWAQNGFSNTDLDFQLKQHGIAKVIVIGLLGSGGCPGTPTSSRKVSFVSTFVSPRTLTMIEALVCPAGMMISAFSGS